MIDQLLIEEQLGCEATCVVILQEDVKLLKNSYNVKADKSTSNMLLGELSKENLKNNLDKLAEENDMAYLIIEEINELDSKQQEKYINLVKSREFRGYYLPENVIIVLTIKSKEDLNKIASELYHFCVVTF